MKIAIDGPAGSGKSTIAKEVASRLGITYIDTGAMYRAITLKLLNENEKDFEKILKDTKIEFKEDFIFLDGKDVSSEIRKNEISNKTSEMSKNPLIREYLVEMQRHIAENIDVVMEGRDIGSVVLKDAEHKFFLTADVEVRARRRFNQLLEKNKDIEFETVLEDLKKRDYNDTHRKNSPLIQTDDAILIDSSNLNLEETVNKILEYIR
ncbi:(d)CMP kinase [Peptoniphilus sp. MSJ-1]|uniref:Cytidylate kinase n=1 Tax=Peptoniphilus ovalis TaxID=2841503 RepID=A0ABS6FI49_9FIRM|nr:(d)CMP kinase [Peptoniphilus ovalis]MBU5669167.1 (d)CMP kinase [Peptoniphilus ovalis]